MNFSELNIGETWRKSTHDFYHIYQILKDMQMKRKTQGNSYRRLELNHKECTNANATQFPIRTV